MGDFNQITTLEANKLIEKGGLIIVDIRDPNSYNSGHIKDAMPVNESNIEDFLKKADRQKPLLCYCYYGISSQGAAQYFRENGFKEVYSMEGGFEEWKTKYPFVND